MTAKLFVVVEALSVEGMVTELALDCRGGAVLLPLVVDKTGLCQGSESTTYFIAVKGKDRCCVPCFTTAFLLIFAVFFICFLLLV